MIFFLRRGSNQYGVTLCMALKRILLEWGRKKEVKTNNNIGLTILIGWPNFFSMENLAILLRVFSDIFIIFMYLFSILWGKIWSNIVSKYAEMFNGYSVHFYFVYISAYCSFGQPEFVRCSRSDGFVKQPLLFGGLISPLCKVVHFLFPFGTMQFPNIIFG